MDLTRIAPRDRQHIQKYGPNGFTVSGVSYGGPILVFADETLQWNVAAPDSLIPESFNPVIEKADDLDLCLLGCGSRMNPISSELRTWLKGYGIGIEAMDTGAACRTL